MGNVKITDVVPKNFKLGTTQVQRVYLGTTLIWSCNATLNFTITERIEFDGDVTVYNSSLLGLVSYIYTGTIDNMTSVGESTYTALGCTKTYDTGLNKTILTQVFQGTKNISLADALYFKLTGNWFAYSNNSGYNSFSLVSDTNPVQINPSSPGTVTLYDSNSTFPVYVSTSQYKIQQVRINSDNVLFDNNLHGSGIWLKLVLYFTVTQGNSALTVNSKVRFNPIRCTLNGEDDTGTLWNMSDFWLSYDDFDERIYNEYNGTLSLTLYKFFGYPAGTFRNSWAEASLPYYDPNTGQPYPSMFQVSLDGSFNESSMIQVYVGEEYTLYAANEVFSGGTFGDNMVMETLTISKFKSTITHYVG